MCIHFEGCCRYAIGVGALEPDEFSHWILLEKGVKEQVRGVSLWEWVGTVCGPSVCA